MAVFDHQALDAAIEMGGLENSAFSLPVPMKGAFLSNRSTWIRNRLSLIVKLFFHSVHLDFSVGSQGGDRRLACAVTLFSASLERSTEPVDRPKIEQLISLHVLFR